MPNPHTRRRRRRPKAVWKVVLIDILTAALILGIYAVFKLVLPAMRGSAAVSVPAPTPAPVEAAEPAPAENTEPSAEPLEATPEPTPEPTPDPRTPWQIKFAEHFTDEPVLTDHSYTSPEVAIDIQSFSVEENGWTSVYHVADIYVASLDNFKTYTVNGELKYWSTADMMDLDRESNAILAISGDFYSYQQSGFIMRNAQLYSSAAGYADICVLFSDGRMETFAGRQYDVEQILSGGAVQIWQFGPVLLDAEGHAMTSFPGAQGTVNQPNPRSAIGYYEPGHYCFVVVDGRQDDYSKGVTVPELAQIFEELGCPLAYNLDGGGSALMTFLHERYSRQSNGAGRELGDMLIVTEEGWEEKR